MNTTGNSMFNTKTTTELCAGEFKTSRTSFYVEYTPENGVALNGVHITVRDQVGHPEDFREVSLFFLNLARVLEGQPEVSSLGVPYNTAVKVGDRVRILCTTSGFSQGTIQEVAAVDPEDARLPCAVINRFGNYAWLENYEFEIVR